MCALASPFGMLLILFDHVLVRLPLVLLFNFNLAVVMLFIYEPLARIWRATSSRVMTLKNRLCCMCRVALR